MDVYYNANDLGDVAVEHQYILIQHQNGPFGMGMGDWMEYVYVCAGTIKFIVHYLRHMHVRNRTRLKQRNRQKKGITKQKNKDVS